MACSTTHFTFTFLYIIAVRNVPGPWKYSCIVQFIACKIKANLSLKTYVEIKYISSFTPRALYPRRQNQWNPHCTGGWVCRTGNSAVSCLEPNSVRPDHCPVTELSYSVLSTFGTDSKESASQPSQIWKSIVNRKAHLIRKIVKSPMHRMMYDCGSPSGFSRAKIKERRIQNSTLRHYCILRYQTPSWARVSTSRTTQTSGMCSLFIRKHFKKN
jgi:hypothetical protein